MSDLHEFLEGWIANINRDRGALIDTAANVAPDLGLNPDHVRSQLEALVPKMPKLIPHKEFDGGQVPAPAVHPPIGLPRGEGILGSAAKHRGLRYTWGGNGIDTFDCSALTQRAHRDNGITIGRTTYDQIKQGREITWGEQQIGDLIFSRFSAPGRPEHVSIWAGNGKVFEAGDPLDYYTWGSRGTVRVRRMW